MVDDLSERIRANLTDDLLAPGYADNPRAHCYVASEAYFHLAGGKEAGLVSMHIRHEGSSHWFLCGPGGVIDLTVDQFQTPVPYDKARPCGFLTKAPSRRAKILMDRVR